MTTPTVTVPREPTEIQKAVERILAAARQSGGDGFAGALLFSDVLALVNDWRQRNRDARRYKWLRSRPLDSITGGGVFAGMTPQNIVLNGVDLDVAIDAEMAKEDRWFEGFVTLGAGDDHGR